MRVIVSDFISLDGVVQAPGGKEQDTEGGFADGGWSMPYFDPEAMGAAIDEAIGGPRRCCSAGAPGGSWPSLARSAGDPFADRMNELPKYVASRTLNEADLEWNTTLLPADDAVGAMRRAPGGPRRGTAVMGSASLAEQLVANDLVDEYRLMLEPILLGGGKRMFPSDGTARRSSWSRSSDRGHRGAHLHLPPGRLYSCEWQEGQDASALTLTAQVAEGVGFEPTVTCATMVFETIRFGRSRIPPGGMSGDAGDAATAAREELPEQRRATPRRARRRRPRCRGSDADRHRSCTGCRARPPSGRRRRTRRAGCGRAERRARAHRARFERHDERALVEPPAVPALRRVARSRAAPRARSDRR